MQPGENIFEHALFNNMIIRLFFATDSQDYTDFRRFFYVKPMCPMFLCGSPNAEGIIKLPKLSLENFNKIKTVS